MARIKKSRLLLALLVGCAPACSGLGAGDPAASSALGPSSPAMVTRGPDLGDGVHVTVTTAGSYKNVCGGTTEMKCHAMIRTDALGHVQPESSPSGLSPANFISAYAITHVASTTTPVIAIIDAEDDPNAEADLGVYRSQFGMAACTTANGCFKKMDQNGGTSYPASDTNPNTSWAPEIALDIEMASAACPTCNIWLFEATTASTANLGTAVNTAASLGAIVISNSYGGTETSYNTTADTLYYKHTGATIFASAGDHTYTSGVQYPAAGAWVVGVGGTKLQTSAVSRGWTESVWDDSPSNYWGTGSGCSSYTATPLWQASAPSGCAHKMVADLSAEADPVTGASVYESFVSGGWIVEGGTSLSSPLVAGIFAYENLGGVSPGLVWDYGSVGFFDVTSGNNLGDGGVPCTAHPFFCQAQTGYDGPTGWGTPNGAYFPTLPQLRKWIPGETPSNASN